MTIGAGAVLTGVQNSDFGVVAIFANGCTLVRNAVPRTPGTFTPTPTPSRHLLQRWYRRLPTPLCRPTHPRRPGLRHRPAHQPSPLLHRGLQRHRILLCRPIHPGRPTRPRHPPAPGRRCRPQPIRHRRQRHVRRSILGLQPRSRPGPRPAPLRIRSGPASRPGHPLPDRKFP